MEPALDAPAHRGLLRVVSPAALTAADQKQAQDQAQASATNASDQALDGLSAHIRTEFEMMRTHRNSIAGWNERLLHAQRTFRGEYDAQKLAQIRQFQGSEIYARITAVKCRGASALLREVYLGPDRPWGLEPTPDPVLPDDITDNVANLVKAEVQSMESMGQPIDLTAIKDRTTSLMQAARTAAKRQAALQADDAEQKLDDKLAEGGFYAALAEFVTDLPLFPFACLKGPTVRIVPDVVWKNGKAVTENRPKMFWNRVSPFDVYFTPGVSDIADADVIERTRLTRADLNQLLGLPGYDEKAIRAVLDEYGRGGLAEWLEPTDTERAVNENRESPIQNRSGLIDCLEFHGSVQGRLLLEKGWSKDVVKDELRDYFVQAWLIGRHVIKVQVAPSPRQRHPYYTTSFEKVPGTPVGNALPDILEDIQNAGNATLRALVNNLAIASGPQVVVNDDVIAPGTDADSLYPWKRWHYAIDPMTNTGSLKPVDFFQPDSRAQELLGVYEKLTQFADDLSAIPRYVTGSERLGGAGRTASGLAMLMGNANKVLQTVAANIDRDVIQPLLQGLYDLVMLTDKSGTFRGDEAIVVKGVAVAVQRETNRQRQIEFLTATNNPVDLNIIGPEGRAALLRSISKDIGIEDAQVVPSEDDLKEKIQAAQQAQQAQQAAQQAQIMATGGAPGGAPGGAAGSAGYPAR
jgi:hypothetical protein